MAAAAQKKVEKPKIFVWEGSDKSGRRVKGESRAASMALVRAELRKQGIAPLKVKKKATAIFNMKKKITPSDIAIFSRQLATMMEAGVPLVQAFDIVGRGHENPAMQDLILAI
ncbi:MAG: type II secretion system F family protein, partial [Candidatus Sedimenticola sp. (ex Thyasira tokunagai)]